MAAGQVQGLALLANSTVYSWGMLTNGFGWNVTTQPNLTNVTAIACGTTFDMALSNGTVVAWGNSSDGETGVPSYLSNVIAIAAHGYHGMALQSNGTVVTWGTVPGGLTNPPPLINPVAIATGNAHFLALQSNGVVVAWGDNTFHQTNVPAGLSNVMAIAAGDYFSMALLNNGTIVEWGDSTYGQTSVPQFNTNYPINVKLIAAGGNHAMAGIWSSLVQYPVNVATDLLLLYNSNSLDSWNVCEYYRTNRPMVNAANELPINCTINETISPSDFTTNFIPQVQRWLTNHPTKRPQYVILFPFLPSRVNTDLGPPYNNRFDVNGQITNVQCQLNASCWTNWHPFVTSINMNGGGGTNDCIAYINKLRYFGTNYCLGQLTISPRQHGYANTNYYFDDTGAGINFRNGASAETGVSNANPTASVIYQYSSNDTLTNHITNGFNVAGYMSWGANSSLGSNYISEVNWTNTNNSWWIIRTMESFNGMRYSPETLQGNFLNWFSAGAFFGSNYTNTPVAGISYTDEPASKCTFDNIYFGLWESGKNFAICAWNSININGLREVTVTPPFTINDDFLQAVGDPFVTK